MRPGDVVRFADLTWHTVRHLAVTGLLRHRAGRVRNLLRPSFAGVAAHRVRNLPLVSLAGPATDGVRHLLGATFPVHRAHGVGNSAVLGFTGPAAGGVRDLLGVGVRHLTADGVRNLAGVTFLHIASAADLPRLAGWAPPLAADLLGRALNLLLAALAGAINAAALAGIPDAFAGGAVAAVHHRARNALGVVFPMSTGDLNALGLGDRPAGRVTHVAVAGLSFGAASRAADRPAVLLVARFADGVAVVTVTGLVARFANRVTNIAVARGVARLPAGVTNGAVARLLVRNPHLVANGLAALLIDRLAHRVTFIAVAGVVHRSVARDRHLFDTAVIDRVAFRVFLLTPNSFRYCFVAGAAADPRLTIVTARSACMRWTTPIPADSTKQACISFVPRGEQQGGCHDREPRHVFHVMVPLYTPIGNREHNALA